MIARQHSQRLISYKFFSGARYQILVVHFSDVHPQTTKFPTLVHLMLSLFRAESFSPVDGHCRHTRSSTLSLTCTPWQRHHRGLANDSGTLTWPQTTACHPNHALFPAPEQTRHRHDEVRHPRSTMVIVERPSEPHTCRSLSASCCIFRFRCIAAAENCCRNSARFRGHAVLI